jgi:flagellar M-ring protein FliF
MNKVLGQLTHQFNEFFKNLSPIKRSSIIASSLVVVISFGVLIVMVSGKNYSILLKNVTAENLPVVLDQLRKKNIPFSMKDDGKTILVPDDLLHSTQMALMSEMGSEKFGTIGLELFEKQDFGVTSYAQRINYQRALQGELTRAINTLTSVKQSKVLLALPAKKTFMEEGGTPTASVVIELHPGMALSPDQVRGITHLVASSVENLDASRVTVVDDRGKVLSKNQSAEATISGELIDIQRRLESSLEDRIENMLSRVVGSGKAIVKVDATINPQHTTMVEEIIDPDATALRSQTTEEELLDGARTNPVGIPGARANLPGAEDQGEVGFRQNVRKEAKTNNFAVPKTVKNIREAAGALSKVSVAVIVDGTTKTKVGENGESVEEWIPMPAAELAKLESIVKNAVGYNEKRGDSVRIENIPFQKEDFAEANKILTFQERKKLLHGLFKWSLLGFSLALFFFVVVRPFMRWVTDSFQESVEDMLPRTIEELEELQAVDNTLPGMSGALPVLEESIDPDKAESELLKERILALMADNEEKAAGAFSLWLARKDG